MKKLVALIVLLILAVSASAETLSLGGITVDIPDSFGTPLGDDGEYTYYDDKGHLDVIVYDGIDDIDTALGFFYDDPSDLDTKPVDLHGIEAFEVTDDGRTHENLGIVFVHDGSAYYFCYESADRITYQSEKLFKAIEKSIRIPDATGTAEATSSSAPQEVPDYPTLQKGDKGDDVKTLQQRLIDLYWLGGKADGDYGNKTKSAVERFQEAADLEITGIADAYTQAALYADDAPEAEMDFSVSLVAIGSQSTAVWYVDGQEFTLRNRQSKTLNTPWGRYTFYGDGYYEKAE